FRIALRRAKRRRGWGGSPTFAPVPPKARRLKAGLHSKPAQRVEKVRLRRPFPRVERCFPLVPAGLPGGKQRKETLQGKASASAAHVAGCGLHLEGFGPPNLPEGFFDSLSRLAQQACD